MARTLVAVALTALCSGSLSAAPPAGRAPAPAAGAVDPAARAAAAQRGLAWLEQHALGVVPSEGTPTRPFMLAFTGLDVLLDAGAYAPGGARAKLLAAVRRELHDYLDEVERRVADPTNLPAAHGLVESSKLVQYVWPVALSGWLLSECVARDLEATAARKDLLRIARLLEEAQQADGGWGHGRIAGAAPAAPRAPAGPLGRVTLSGYPPTLLAPTNCAATAIGCLDRAQGRGSSEAAKRVLTHFREAVLRNGNFPYDIRQRSADSDLTGVGRTAGALVSQHVLGAAFDDPVIQRSIAFLRAHWELVGEGHGSPVLNLVFGALAARVLGPGDVKTFEDLWVPRVLAAQSPAGDFDCACRKVGFAATCDSPTEHGGGIAVFAESQRAYVTALTTFVLLLDRSRPRFLEPGPRTPARAVTPR